VILPCFFPTTEFAHKLLPNFIRIETGHRYCAEGSTSMRNRSRSEVIAGERDDS
jgi:hypothetical protein